MAVWFWTVFLVVVFTMGAASIKSEYIYHKAKEFAKKRKSLDKQDIKYGEMEKKMGILRFILFFLYPRIADVQKNAFFIIGFLIGIVYFNIEGLTGFDLRNAFYRAAYVWFILDFLVYQARYLWNDLRGLEFDSIHPEKGKRKRLPVEVFGDKAAIVLASVIIVFRLVAAFVLINEYGGALKVPLTLGVVKILLIAALYEYEKTKNNAFTIFALVPWGYPIRLFLGIISAWPQILQYLISDLPHMLVLLLLLFATTAFGEVFVSLTWCLDAVFLVQSGTEVKKAHYHVLCNQVPDYCKGNDYPLICKDRWGTIWNKYFCFTVFFLQLACVIIISPVLGKWPIMISILSGIITVFISFQIRKRGGRAVKCGNILLFLFSVLECIYVYKCGIITDFILYVVLIMLRIGYSMVYQMFRHSNYLELVNFSVVLKNRIKSAISWLLMSLLGVNAYSRLFR